MNQNKLNRNIRLSYLTTFLVELIFVIPIWVLFYRRFITFSQMAVLILICDLFVIFLELPTGALADLIGRKKTIIIGWILKSISLAWIAFSNTWTMFLLAGLLGSLGGSLISGSDTALIYDTFKELGKENKFKKYQAKKGLFGRIALVVGSLTGGYMYKIWPGLPYIVMSLLQGITAIVVIFMVEPHIDTEKFSLASYIRQTRIGLSHLFRTKWIKSLSIFYIMIGGFSWSAVYYLNQPFAIEFGFDEIQLSWLFAGVYLLSSITIFFLTEKSKLGRQIYLMFPALLIIAYLPGIFAGKIFAFISILLLQIAASGRFAILDHEVNKEFESKYRATSISSLNMLVSIVSGTIIGIAGPFQDIFSTRLFFTLLGFASLAIILPQGLSLYKD